MPGNGHVRFGGRGRGNRRLRGRTAPRLRPQHLPLAGEAASALFQVVSRRYLKSSICLTTNRGVAQWAEIFNDDSMVAAAMLDRLLHRATVIHIDGESYRMRTHRAAAERLRTALAVQTGRSPADGAPNRAAVRAQDVRNRSDTIHTTYP